MAPTLFSYDQSVVGCKDLASYWIAKIRYKHSIFLWSAKALHVNSRKVIIVSIKDSDYQEKSGQNVPSSKEVQEQRSQIAYFKKEKKPKTTHWNHCPFFFVCTISTFPHLKLPWCWFCIEDILHII